MDIKIDITGEDINRELTAAVANSLIGQQIQKVIKDEVERLSRSYDNPLQPVVRDIIHGMIRNLLLNDFKEPIETMVRERLTPAIQQDLIDKAWKALLDR